MSEENKTIVRRYVEEGLNQENLVLFDELLAPFQALAVTLAPLQNGPPFFPTVRSQE